MKRTIPYVVSCLSLYVLGCILLPLELKSMAEVANPTNNAPGDTLIFSVNECNEIISICLDSLPLAVAINLSIMVNGAPYQETLAGCNFDTISAFTYTTLFGQGNSGPYELTNWTVGDTVYAGRFENIPDLVDSMNLWDAAGNWQLDETFKLISGGDGSTNYSDMIVEVIGLSSPSFIGYNFGMEANGTQLSFGTGIHRVSILDSLNNTYRNAVIVVSCASKQVATLNLKEGTNQTYCLDTSILIGPLTNLFNDCPTKIGDATKIILDNTAFCANISGETPGQDTACLVLCNQFGSCDTTILYINVHPTPTTETIQLTIFTGDSLKIYPSDEELAGLVTGIDNLCKNNSTETIISNINNVDLYFNISAQNLGIDSICAVICDNFLICDTTYYVISVVSRSPSLAATPDLDSTSINSPISINILGNDSIPDGIITEMELITLSTEPTSSTITFNPDGTLNYVPAPDFCGDIDQFQYRICNNTGCDTTTVTIYVECTPIPSGMKFYNGFSPNGDGTNDLFKIEGIAQYPNNELIIYNRWGTKVFSQKGYKNAWDGTWNNTILPDGTYFYVLQDGEGKKYSGYVEISR